MKNNGSISKLEAAEVLELILFMVAVGIFFFFVPLKAQAQLEQKTRVCHLNPAHTGEKYCTGTTEDLPKVTTSYSDLENWLLRHSADSSQGPGEKE